MSDSASDEPIIVAVRACPFSNREKSQKPNVLEISGSRTSLTDPKTGAIKDFSYESSFWSVDKSRGIPADNKAVYRGFGFRLTESCLAGYNATLLCYGQTGTGKSTTLFGSSSEPGLASYVIDDLVSRTPPDATIEMSMMTIYNEQVRDALNLGPQPRGGLKVVDHYRAGVHVPLLSRHVVKSKQHADTLLADAKIARAVVAVHSNSNSARTHTVVMYTLRQKFKGAADEIVNRISTISMFDLAGSESGGSAPTAPGDIEASGSKKSLGPVPKINIGITTLSDAITQLAKTAGSASAVPFTASRLTTLLRASLVGSSKTLFLGHVLPVSEAYNETLATLRIADRMKRLRTRPAVCDNPYQRAAEELKVEIAKLEQNATKVTQGRHFSELSDLERNALSQAHAEAESARRLHQWLMPDVADLVRMTEESEKARAEALQSLGVEGVGTKSDGDPHIVALHSDPFLSGVLQYRLADGVARVCRPTVQPPPGSGDIVVEGLQLLQHHAQLSTKSKTTTLKASKGARVFVNGSAMADATALGHGNRIVMGAYLVFLYEGAGMDFKRDAPTYADVLQETSSSAVATMIGLDDIAVKQTVDEDRATSRAKVEALKKELEQCREGRRLSEEVFSNALADVTRRVSEVRGEGQRRLQAASRDELSSVRAEVEAAGRAVDEERSQLISNWEKAKSDYARREDTLQTQLKAADDTTPEAEAARNATIAGRRAEKGAALMGILPMVNEANALFTELRQLHLRASVKLVSDKDSDESALVGSSGVGVRVTNSDSDLEVVFSVGMFAERLIAWRGIYDTYVAHGEMDLSTRDEDNPFYIVPVGPQLVGTCRVLLQPLYYLLPVSERTPIIDYKGDTTGKLDLRIIPLPRGFRKGDNEEDLYFDEEDLTAFTNDTFFFMIRIKRASGLAKRYLKDVFVRFKLFLDDEESKSEPAVYAANGNPKIEYKRTVKVDLVTKDFIKSLHDAVLEIQVYGSIPDEVKVDSNWAKLAGIVEGTATGQQPGTGTADAAGVGPAANDAAKGANAKISALASDPEALLKRVQDVFEKTAALEKERRALDDKLYDLQQTAAAQAAAAGATVQKQEGALKDALEREKQSRDREKEIVRERAEERQKERERRAKETQDKTAMDDEKGGSKPGVEAPEIKALREQAEAAEDQEIVALRVKLATNESALEDERKEAEKLREELAVAKSKVKETLEKRRDDRRKSLTVTNDAIESMAAASAQTAVSDAALMELKQKLEEAEQKMKEQESMLLVAKEAAQQAREEADKKHESELERTESEHAAEVKKLRDVIKRERSQSKGCTLL